MKKYILIILFLFIALLQFSCFKDNDTQTKFYIRNDNDYPIEARYQTYVGVGGNRTIVDVVDPIPPKQLLFFYSRILFIKNKNVYYFRC